MCHLCGYLHDGDPFGAGRGPVVHDLGTTADGTSGSTAGSTAPVGTLSQMADYLTMGYWAETSTWRAPGVAVPLDTRASNKVSVNLQGLDADGKTLARWALESWEYVADLDFVETNGSADITFHDDEGGAYASFSSDGTYILEADVYVPESWVDAYGVGYGSYAYFAYIHEIGHALGLGHMGAYNGGNVIHSRDATFANDSHQLSVMSYFSQSENPTVTASEARPITPMLVDIVAARDLYGAPGAGSPTAGNTTWGTGATGVGFLDAFFDASEAGSATAGLYLGAVTYVIADAGGVDTWDWSASTQPANYFSMAAGTFSSLYGGRENVSIAPGTVIEHAIFGSGRDTIIGNGAHNRIDSGGSNDSVTGGAGDDTLYGGAGNDRIFGNSALDTIYGEAGNDYISSGDGRDFVNGGSGNDTVYGRSGWDVLKGGAGDDWLYGSEGDDTLRGETGNDVVSAGSAWDKVWGGTGSDTLYGNFGSDEIRGEEGNDLIYGGSGDDTLIGGSGNDRVYGNQGRDVVDGGSGNDALRGGTLSDSFVFNRGHDSDRIEDFEITEDVLTLSRTLTGGRDSAASVLSAFGEVSGGAVVLDFGRGDRVVLEDVTALSALGADNFAFF